MKRTNNIALGIVGYRERTPMGKGAGLTAKKWIDDATIEGREGKQRTR